MKSTAGGCFDSRLSDMEKVTLYKLAVVFSYGMLCKDLDHIQSVNSILLNVH